MRIIASSDRRAVARLLVRSESRDPGVERTAAKIVANVRRHGDRALRKWMSDLDDVRPPFEVSPRDL
jgi:histidinol dehydrogenase